MNPHARAIVATGMAFPIGLMLGATAGVALGDLAFAFVSCLFVPIPLTLTVFWRTTRHLDWSWQRERRAYARVFSGAFTALGVVMAVLWWWTNTLNAALVFVALPLGSTIVTLRTKSALEGVA